MDTIVLVEKVGASIDVLLVNGTLKEGDTIILCGMNGPIESTIRQLIVPKPLEEIRDSHAICDRILKVDGVQGVKILGIQKHKSPVNSIEFDL